MEGFTDTGVRADVDAGRAGAGVSQGRHRHGRKHRSPERPQRPPPGALRGTVPGQPGLDPAAELRRHAGWRVVPADQGPDPAAPAADPGRVELVRRAAGKGAAAMKLLEPLDAHDDVQLLPVLRLEVLLRHLPAARDLPLQHEVVTLPASL